MLSDSVAQAIDRYMEILRKHCAKVSSAETDEFVGEIRSHIMDRIAVPIRTSCKTLRPGHLIPQLI
jgi:hypothetical protein